MDGIQSTQNHAQIAESFWQKAGGIKSWPCDLDIRPVNYIFPL